MVIIDPLPHTVSDAEKKAARAARTAKTGAAAEVLTVNPEQSSKCLKVRSHIWMWWPSTFSQSQRMRFGVEDRKGERVYLDCMVGGSRVWGGESFSSETAACDTGRDSREDGMCCACSQDVASSSAYL